MGRRSLMSQIRSNPGLSNISRDMRGRRAVRFRLWRNILMGGIISSGTRNPTTLLVLRSGISQIDLPRGLFQKLRDSTQLIRGGGMRKPAMHTFPEYGRIGRDNT